MVRSLTCKSHIRKPPVQSKEINNFCFGSIHSNSTLYSENDMCHVVPPIYRPPFGQMFSSMHHRVIRRIFFPSFLLKGSVFPTVSVDKTHVSCSPYDFLGHFLELPRFACHHANNTLCVLACSWALRSIHTANLALFYRHSPSHKEAPPVFHFYFLSISAMFTTSPLLVHRTLHPFLANHYRVYVKLFYYS